MSKRADRLRLGDEASAAPRRRPMRIWITRSEPGATALAQAVEAAGFVAVKAPVLEIRPLPFAPPAGHFDFAVFLSVHGVRLAAGSVKGRFDHGFAIGQGTAAALAEAGLSAQAASLESSEGLLDVLPNSNGRRVLLVTGKGGRNLIASALAEQGADVRRLRVYERAPVSPTLDPKRIDAVVTSSGDGFQQAVGVWFASGGAADAPFLAPSARVASLGAQLGVSRVLCCAGAGADAVVAVLRQMVGADG